jgi:LysR family transcriptional activator of nhaA
MSVKIQNQSLWLNYHHLFYFYTIAREGSIAQAAEKLNLGQPTLSTQLKQLEDSLGQKLFQREKKRLKLTEAGRIALEYSEEVFRLGSEMIDAIQDRILPNRVQIQIGALDSVPKNIVLELTRQAYKNSNCLVSILEGRENELFRELEAHRLDLIISNSPPPAEKSGVYVRSVAKLEVLIWGHPKFKGLKKNFPLSLDGQPLILPTQHSQLRHELDHYFKSHQVRPDHLAETQDSSIQGLLGIAGMGLVPLSSYAAKNYFAEKELIPLGTLKNVHEEIWLITGKRRVENPVAEYLIKNFKL